MIKISDKDNARQKFRDWIISVYDGSRDMLARSSEEQTFLDLSEDDKIQVLLNSDIELQARLLAYMQKSERSDYLKKLRTAQSERLDRWVERRIQRNKRVEAFDKSMQEGKESEASKMLESASIMECAEMLSCIDNTKRKQFLVLFSENKSDEINNRIKYVTMKRLKKEDLEADPGLERGLLKICKECLPEQAEWIAEQDNGLREKLKTKILDCQWAQLKKQIEQKDLSLRLEWKYSFINAGCEQRKEILAECSEPDKATLLSLLDQKSRRALLSNYNDAARERLNGLVEEYSQQRFLDNIYRFSGTIEKSSKRVKVYKTTGTFEKWELAESLPDSLAAIVAIAMVEERTRLYNKSGQSTFSEETCAKRNNRLERVREKIRTYHHREFVPRSLEEVLLVEVIRGIYTLFEVPAVLNRFYEECTEEEENLTKQMVSDIAADLKSTIIWNALLRVGNKNDMEKIMRDNKRVFLVDRRTVGTRLRRGFIENHGYPFKYGLKIYSPDINFETRVTKRAQYDRFYQREYLLSTLIPLHYSVDQINSYLKSDGLVAVSENQNDPENIMIRQGIYVDEYMLADALLSYDGCIPEKTTIAGIFKRLRYQYVQDIDMKIRVGYLCVLTEYLKTCPVDLLLPADHYINYVFRDNGNSKRVAEQVVKEIRKPNFDLIKGKTKLIEKMKPLKISEKDRKNLKPEEVARLDHDYEAFKGQFKEYYDIPLTKLPGDIDSEMLEMARKIRFFSAISFSVMTGRQYDGVITRSDELTTAREELSLYDNELKKYLFAIWNYFLHANNTVVVEGGFFRSPYQPGRAPNEHIRLEMTNMETIQHKLFDIWKKYA